LTNFWYAICGLSYLLKTKTHKYIFLPRNGPPSLGYLNNKKNDDETFGWWGFRNGDTTRKQTTTTNHFHGGRNLCLTPF
jgi:hypothetical protein